MKDVKRRASELPVAPSGRKDDGSGGGGDPNVIPPEDVQLLATLGLAVGNRLKRGRYGVVYEGAFAEDFSLDKLTSHPLHYLFVRPEQQKPSGDMRPGHKFAIKFCDTELRKAYHIEDIETRVKQEIQFVKRVTYEPSTAVVRFYCVLASKPSRHYIVMEKADDNLQCVLHTNDSERHNQLLTPQQVLALYDSLIGAVRSLHQQKLTYGMMRTSNILVFNQAAAAAAATPDGAQAGLAPFRVKIADFVRSVEMDAKDVAASVVEDAVEEDLDDLFYVHAELFTLSRFDFAKYQAFKESLKVLTDMNAHRNSLATLDKVLELVDTFSREHQHV